MSPQHEQAIVFLADANYLPAAFVVARQALAAFSGVADVVIVATDEATAALVSGLEPRIRTLVMQDDLVPDQVPRNANRPKMIYSRLLIDRILGTDYRRILYLDADLWLLSADASRLLLLDLKGKSIAAVRTIGDLVRRPGYAEYKAQLGVPPELPCFNTGVMLIDLDRFRSEGIGTRALDYVTGGGFRGGLHDQSALNHVLKGDFLELSPLWNWQASSRPEDHPAGTMIVHFVELGIKPWNDPLGRLGTFYRDHFRQELADTPWSGFVKMPGEFPLWRRGIGHLHGMLRASRATRKRQARIDAMTGHLRTRRFADLEQGLIEAPS